MSLLTEMIKAVELYRSSGLQCIFVHTERLPELIRELDRVQWRHDDTGETTAGYSEMRTKEDATDPDGAIVRLADVPVFEDRGSICSLYTPDKKRILFYTRRLQENGINLLQAWNEHPL